MLVKPAHALGLVVDNHMKIIAVEELLFAGGTNFCGHHLWLPHRVDGLLYLLMEFNQFGNQFAGQH
ncbi:hypothetical protein D3C77_792240 [compost metagenome]